MEKEVHLFIIWEKGRIKEKEIINDIRNNFEVLSIRYITWTKKKFSENLTRFYGQNLPSSSQKVKECGIGEFVLVVVRDNNPLYLPRKTTKGVKFVNVNVFDRKEMYRYWTGGGNKVHATNSEAEVNHDLTLLTGYNAADFMKHFHNSDNKIVVEKKDLIGAFEWNSFSQLLYTLNNCIEYVILRNFEELPENIIVGEHGDVDFLTSNLHQFELIANSIKVSIFKFRVREIVNISGKKIYCDIRYSGDNYYCLKWEKDILSNRILNERGFYIPDTINLFYSLLYHTLIHKTIIADDYKEKLYFYANKINLQFPIINFENRSNCVIYLEDYLKSNGYSITEPIDLSVFFNSSDSSFVVLKKYKVKKLIYRILCKIIR